MIDTAKNSMLYSRGLKVGTSFGLLVTALLASGLSLVLMSSSCTLSSERVLRLPVLLSRCKDIAANGKFDEVNRSRSSGSCRIDVVNFSR